MSGTRSKCGKFKRTKEMNELQRIAHLGKKYKPMSEKGKENIRKAHRSQEVRDKIRKARLGTILSEETKEKICQIVRKNYGEGIKMGFQKGHLDFLTKESRKKIGLASSLRPSGFKGKHHSERAKEIDRIKHLGIKHKNPMSEKGRNNIRKVMRELWQDPEFRKKMIKSFEVSNNHRPTNPEKIFDELTPEYVRYVGNGKWWRNHHNPDFKITGQNKVIEIYGDYWHRNDDPKDRIKEYKEVGLDCLVFWEHEVYNDTQKILEKTLEFINQEPV